MKLPALPPFQCRSLTRYTLWRPKLQRAPSSTRRRQSGRRRSPLTWSRSTAGRAASGTSLRRRSSCQIVTLSRRADAPACEESHGRECVHRGNGVADLRPLPSVSRSPPQLLTTISRREVDAAGDALGPRLAPAVRVASVLVQQLEHADRSLPRIRRFIEGRARRVVDLARVAAGPLVLGTSWRAPRGAA